jgi:hypothetical protein
MMAPIRNHTKTWLWNIKNFTNLPFSSQNSMRRKRFFSLQKRRKWQLHRTLKFKILNLLMKNKWWLTSKNTQNMNLKHKNFTIFPLILREINAEKTHFPLAWVAIGHVGRWRIAEDMSCGMSGKETVDQLPNPKVLCVPCWRGEWH